MERPPAVESTSAVATELADRLDLSRPELLNEPVLSEVYRQLRQRAPIKRVEPKGRYAGDRTWWFLSRYADVRRVFNDDDTFTSNDNTSGGIPGPIDTSPIAFEDVDPYIVATHSQKIPMALDPPEFSPYRRLLNPLFSPGQAKRTESITQKIANDLLDGLKNRERSELHHEFAKPLPAMVICSLLGLPVGEWERWAITSPNVVLPRNATTTDRDAVMNRVVPSLDAQMTMLKLAEERRREPREDIITAVAHMTADGGRLLNYYELGAVLSILLSGGVHTTTLAIESALAYVGRTAGIHRRLSASPELVRPFCEEVLRMWPPLQAFYRKARKDVVIDGVQISAGDGILLGMGSANRDPEEFPDPDDFVLERHPNRHLTFALGIHRCLGSNLARQELFVAVNETIRQLPAFTVDEEKTEINLRVDPVAYEPSRKLTVVFDR